MGPIAASDALTDSEVELGGASTSAQAASLDPEQAQSSQGQPPQVGTQPQSPISGSSASSASNSEQAQATASEQQAAADMSSMGQQDTGQFDPQQAARVTVEQNLDASAASLSSTGEPAAGPNDQQDAVDAQQPKSNLTAYGQKKGRPKMKKDEDVKPKKSRGRPKKSQD